MRERIMHLEGKIERQNKQHNMEIDFSCQKQDTIGYILSTERQ